jgi:DNA-binding XRE family transcriptional regulator
MKKIINGKRYSTDAARKIGTWSNDFYTNDFRWCTERLYQKRTGEYFLFGEGGPMSRHSKSVGDMTASGEEIIPMTAEETREWAEERLTAEEYEAEFKIEEEALSPIADRIKTLREAQGLSQTELASKIGISQQAVAGYENGQEMTVSRLLEICKALGITAAEFFF